MHLQLTSGVILPGAHSINHPTNKPIHPTIHPSINQSVSQSLINQQGSQSVS